MKSLLLASSAVIGAALPLSAPAAVEAAPTTVDRVVVTGVRTALTVPDTAQATAAIERVPGAVEVIPDTAFKNGPASTIKDIFGKVPGVVVQSRWGPDARLSIRGSGLSRNYGNRGVNAFLDGVPINTADGLFDLFEIDPSALRYVEVFKGANAMRYGAGSLGGAINFVTPSGRDASEFDSRIDAGSFGFVRTQASTGGSSAATDWFVTASAQREEGYRDHSNGRLARFSGNVGYQVAPNVETRFYLNANTWRGRIPGEVSKDSALNDPTAANPEWVRQDQQRNIDSVRLSNKTTIRFDQTTVELGLFGVHRHVMHPIYQWLDFTVDDYGGFVRAIDDRSFGDFRNRLIVGANLHNGTIDTEQFVNLTGAVKGPRAASMVDKSQNISAYAENSFFARPDLALVAGVQFLHAERDRRDRFLSNGDQSGSRTYDLWSPKIGVVWDVDPTWQVFGNISRSAEVPTYDANSFASPASSNLKAQTATTYEIGTRGARGDASWDVAIYRAEIKNELQCLTTSPFSACSVVNAGQTVHQGLEAGLNIPVLKATFTDDDRVWFNAAYTYNDFKFDDDARYGDNRLPGVPKQILQAELLYRHPGGFYAGPSVEWSPDDYFADNANSLTIDSYALLNLKVGFDTQQGWSAYLEGRNLTDERYISSVAIAGVAAPDAEIFNPGAGRAVYAGLRYNW